MREYTKPANRSKFSLINGGKDIKLFIQSNNPDEFVDDEIEIPSVAAELTYNYKQYHVERSQSSKDYLRIHSYPPIISMIVDTIRNQVQFSKPPGEHPSLCCMISLGIPQIQARKVVKNLGELSATFKRRQKKGNELELYVQSFLRSNVDCPVEKAKYSIITLTPEVNDVLSQISFDTGLTKSSVALLSIYATLIQQVETPPNYKEIYQDRFDTTIKMLECKLDAMKAMIARLDREAEGG